MGSAGLAVCFGRLRRWLAAWPLSTCAILAGLVLLIAGLSPFGFEPGANAMKERFDAAQLIPFGRRPVEPVRSAKPLNWGAELLTWTLAGGLFVLAGRERRVRRARALIGSVVAASVVVSFQIETCQLAVPRATSMPHRSYSRSGARRRAPRLS